MARAVEMMMMAPKVVGVLLKKPGQKLKAQQQKQQKADAPAGSQHPGIPPLDPQETKIRGEYTRHAALASSLNLSGVSNNFHDAL